MRRSQTLHPLQLDARSKGARLIRRAPSRFHEVGIAYAKRRLVKGLQIVAVRAGDAPGIASFRRLLVEYEDALPPDLRIPDLESELRMLAERYAPPGAALLLARDGSRDVGCVAVKPLDDATAEIKRLYVVPSARGSGAGRRLMETAIAFARERGHTRVVLDTERGRLREAYRLYLSLGFVQCEAYAPAEYANPTFMELRLAP